MNWHNLSKELSQTDIYKIINKMNDIGFNISINTIFDDVGIGRLNEEMIYLFRELDKIRKEGNIFKLIMFLELNEIDITKVEFVKDETNVNIYVKCIQCNEEELNKILRLME